MELSGRRRRGHGRDARSWTFLTNHARVLIYIARNPRARLRDMAAAIGITERAAGTIVGDLEEAGYVKRNRIGRRNRYTIDPHRPFRHPAEADHAVEELLSLFVNHPSPAFEQDSANVVASFRAEPPPEP